MHKTTFHICVFLWLILFSSTACRNNSSQTTTTDNGSHMTESARLDSLANELEETTKSIEEQTKGLENALEEL